MSPRGVLVVGSGRRVRDAALPALARAESAFALRAIVARTAKRVESGGRGYDVRAASELAAGDLRDVELVYLAVGKPNVPDALRSLLRFNVSAVDLLIDTPVLLPKHYRHLPLLRRFRNAWVAEDVVDLPWIPLVRSAIESGAIGDVSRVVFDRSAYAYHGVAAAKALLACDRITRARRSKGAGGAAHRELRFANGKRATVIEPRDYAVGRVTIEGSIGAITDDPTAPNSAFRLEPILDGGALAGFRIGDRAVRLDADEAALAAGDPAGATVTARMDSLKRVGFLRMLRAIAEGRGAYPLEQALDDALVDYSLERLGLYVSTPFTSARSPLARAWLRAASAIAGR